MKYLLVVLSLVVSVVALGGAAWVVFSDRGTPTIGACDPEPPDALRAEVRATLPHDPDAFTQGLTLDDEGALWESTGLRGESQVRHLDPSSGEVLAASDLDDELFGEGLTVTGQGDLLQLTWTSGRALEWEPSGEPGVGPEQVGAFDYEGEGWGIATLDDDFYVLSDGSARLQFKDPEEFATVSVMDVARDGGPVDGLNELEWDGTDLWANRYQSDEILRIDLDCGVVDGVVDASALSAAASAAIDEAGLERDLAQRDVLNGIAWLGPDDPTAYYVTGKRWPVMFEVTFEPL